MTEVPERRAPPAERALLASDQERDDAVERLKTALVEGRLTDEEFDQRMRVVRVRGIAYKGQVEARIVRPQRQLPPGGGG